ncbi:MAG: aminotransferase class I/II-fold pyridoxal phosphate-dependent enzyme [Oscillospiraceae bacterium]|nr:aminotransferase class I/II-fold pyridoxal phosphate-dependent enzyme [Oscillospiraceae bacterium]
MKLCEMNHDELLSHKKQWEEEYDKFKALDLKLNMARGKPSPEQLALTTDMLDILNSKSDLTGINGDDYRNYGILDGIPEAKTMFADLLEVSTDEVMIFGNSSLNIMYDVVSLSYTNGINGCLPWCKLDKVKFLCPVPGYDRHFTICESLGIEMVNIPYTDNGPDMDMIEKMVSEDESIKGVWCVPQYSNPSGIVYSDETVKRFAALKPKAKDFRIFWDNAYCVHHLVDEPKLILNIIDECKKAGNENMVYVFASTSKITFPGSGVAALASSAGNLREIAKIMEARTIGHDKLNQLRHVKYFKTAEGIKEHMKKHQVILAPKFSIVIEKLEKEIAPLGIGSWVNPKGGYFISFDSVPGCAKRIVSLCREAGVTLTGAGATYPYGNDPEDKNIRIAPSYPSVEELSQAMDIFCLSIKIASAEKLLEN